jgi:hypothetical protein
MFAACRGGHFTIHESTSLRPPCDLAPPGPQIPLVPFAESSRRHRGVAQPCRAVPCPVPHAGVSACWPLSGRPR